MRSKLCQSGIVYLLRVPYKNMVPFFASVEDYFNGRTNWRCVEWLIRHGHDVNSIDPLGRTALWHACIMNRVDKVKMLMDLGADVNIAERYDKNHTPLSLATTDERLPLLKFLLAQHKHSQETLDDAFFFAVREGEKSSVIALFRAGANPNQFSPSEYPTVRSNYALIEAAQDGNVKMVKLLLEFGSDPDLKDEEGKTAEARAHEMEFPEVEAILKKFRRSKLQRKSKIPASSSTLTKR